MTYTPDPCNCEQAIEYENMLDACRAYFQTVKPGPGGLAIGRQIAELLQRYHEATLASRSREAQRGETK